ncbi:MAG: hypothetical protein HC849_24725, partial [Oscillatoriales cyanobacterium RU_3_3]|nr:hypothetical protein [Oscillatoriales cyanobacterium RU_3_3]
MASYLTISHSHQQHNSASTLLKPIRSATIAHQKYVTASLILAFINDPIMRWMYPDPYQYLAHFPRFVDVFGGKAFTQKTAYCIDGYSGAALWFPPGVEPDVEPLIKLVRAKHFRVRSSGYVCSFRTDWNHYHYQGIFIGYLSLIGDRSNST